MTGRPTRDRSVLLLAVLSVLCSVVPVAAQVGRVSGVVRDETGKPIKAATVVAENVQATPASFTAVTDDKGRWAMIGLQSGLWKFRASAPGYQSSAGSGRVQTIGNNPPMEFRLAKGAPGGPSLAGVNAQELQAELDLADRLLDAGQIDAAITSYEAILAKSPALTMINLPLGRAWRLKKQYDNALAAYQRILDADASNEKAKVEIGMTHLERGDLEAAETTLTAAAESTGASREVFYSLAEVKFARGTPEDAVAWYRKATDADPGWVKPYFKLALVAINRDDSVEAIVFLEKVIEVDPASSEAAQARSLLEQLRPK